MKRFIHANKNAEKHLSGCSFDFDIGKNYDAKRIEDVIFDIGAECGIDVVGVDFRSVQYPRNKEYSQCGFDFEWHGDNYNAKEIERAIEDFIDDEGGNFFGIDFYSLED